MQWSIISWSMNWTIVDKNVHACGKMFVSGKYMKPCPSYSTDGRII